MKIQTSRNKNYETLTQGSTRTSEGLRKNSYDNSAKNARAPIKKRNIITQMDESDFSNHREDKNFEMEANLDLIQKIDLFQMRHRKLLFFNNDGNSSSDQLKIFAILLALLLVFASLFFFRKRTEQKKPRFRKRDKIIFYGRRMLRKIKRKRDKTPQLNLLGRRLLNSEKNAHPEKSDFSTVAVLSNSDEVPIKPFCLELNHSLTAIGTVLHLTSEKVLQQLGTDALDKIHEDKLSSWLSQQKDQHKIVLYQCDSNLTPWTVRCLRQSDCTLVVAMADSEPTVGAVEQQVEHSSVRTQMVELILLHKPGSFRPKDTTRWLNIRPWCGSHHHIRCPQRLFVRKISKIEDIYNELSKTKPSNDNDFARLARFLTGTSIGLVLGGGGARGAAHLGMIKAILEAGIPIDMIGGVSIGAFMGALWAQEADLTRVTQLARTWSFTMTSLWRQILDLTYPTTAMFTGAAFNRTIHDLFGDAQIEDLWLPYFAVTTDITSSSTRIHRYGSLWRYVRSSMSLSGYLPPLCDPVDGHLLLDGGYVNNLPADVMHNVMGAQTILAVDVGSQDETDLTNYGDTLNGWWLLWNRWNPFGQQVRVPSLPEIQSRLAYVSCVRQLEEVKNSEYCSYIRPPIDKFKTLQFGSFDEIFEVGYKHGSALFGKTKICTGSTLLK